MAIIFIHLTSICWFHKMRFIDKYDYPQILVAALGNSYSQSAKYDCRPTTFQMIYMLKFGRSFTKIAVLSVE